MRHQPTFVAYIDESGDEGFSFEGGSSEWFVLAAVVTKRERDVEVVKLVDRARVQLGKPERKPLHFRDLKHEQRLPFIGEISAAELRTITVLIHKPSLQETEKFRDRFRLYFYATRYLLERVSWYCRDHKLPTDPGDGSVEIVFSNRSGMSYDELKGYFDLLEARTSLFDVRVDWDVIRTCQIIAYSPGKRMGLQVADAVASSAFYAFQPSRHGYTENRYLGMLKPVVYHYRGQYLGYGLKFWPRETEAHLTDTNQLEWVKESFGSRAGPGPQDPTR